MSHQRSNRDDDELILIFMTQTLYKQVLQNRIWDLN